MLLASIDIETTGLNPAKHQILEVGIVLFESTDLTTPVEELPTYQQYVTTETGEVFGDPFALAMNAGILQKIANNRDICISEDSLALDIRNWLMAQGLKLDDEGRVKLTCAGKNVAAFDLQFLKRLWSWESLLRVAHRALDPASMFFDPFKDDGLPSMDECCKRAGLPGGTKHDAVGDARLVIQLLRAAWRQ